MVIVIIQSVLFLNNNHLIVQIVSSMMNDETSMEAYRKINDSHTVNDAAFYSGNYLNPDDHGTSQTSVIAPNGDAVSVTSTINFRYDKYGREQKSIYSAILLHKWLG